MNTQVRAHECDNMCDQVECLIGVSVTYMPASVVDGTSWGYVCRNCAWWHETIPERCPQCYFPVACMRDIVT